MNKIDELLKKLCPNGVKYEPLCNKELFSFSYGKGNKIPDDIGGIYDVYGANGIVSHINEYNCEDVSIIGHIGAVGMVNRCRGKCFVTYNGTIADIVDKTKIDSQYLYYVLTTLNLPAYKKGSQPFLSVSDFDKICIPVPPIEVQREIVCVLDQFTLLTTELAAKLSSEVESRKKQYEYYKDELYNFKDKNVKYVKLKEIAEVIRGGNFQKKDFVESGKPCIHYGQIYTKYGSSANSTFTYVTEEVFNKSKQAQPNDIVMAVTSENVEDVCKCVVWCGNENIAVSGHTAIIRHNINAKYLGYYFSTSHFYKDKTKLVHGTKVMEVTPSALNEILIPLPSLEEQERVANLIENYDRLCNDIVVGLPAEIDKRQKQYEYYRDKLLSFKEVEINE